MTQHFLDDLQVRATGEREGCGAVPQIVESDGWEVRLHDEPPEVHGDVVGMKDVPICPGEHSADGVGSQAEFFQLSGLSGLVELEYLEGPPVEGNDPLAPGLGLAAFGGPAELDDLFGDDQRRGPEVEILPSQPHGFTAPESAERDQVVERLERILDCPP